MAELEKGLADFCDSKYCITCCSCTIGLLLSLMAIDLQPGDEVITSPFSFIAAAEMIALLGAKPVFVDITEDTYNLDVSKIEEKITSATRAIMPVSIFGQPADMDEINTLALKYDLMVIEDAAQSFGALYKEKKSCNLSHIGCTSFYPSKPLGGFGDGGAIFTSDEKLASKLRRLMNHGQTDGTYSHQLIGLNGRMDAMQAAVLNVKLKYYSREIEKRQQVANIYTELLKDSKTIIPPKINSDRTSVFAQYGIRVKNREAILEMMRKKALPYAIHYPRPIYQQQAFKYLEERAANYPLAEQVCQEILCLPMWSGVDKTEQKKLVEFIIGVVERIEHS